MLTDDEVAEHMGGPAGYVGPVGVKEGVRVVADHSLAGLAGMVAGANEDDQHLVQVAVGRDFEPELADLRSAGEGDACGRCGNAMSAARGIEVGHVFFLGTKYSEAMGANVLGEDGKERPIVMGCYGIGVGRTAAAAIEQNHDGDGIVWPAPIAPFHVSVVALDTEGEVFDVAVRIAEEIEKAGHEVILDDRKERPGVKFKDHDLLGIPVRVQVGARGLKEGVVEVKRRADGRDKDKVEKLAPDAAAERAVAMVNEMLDAAKEAADASYEKRKA
jgi:prolyl-tRNA synthetase